MVRPFFSIIICTYNRKRLLRRAICSVLAQSCSNWELIIVDDGSTDGTLTWLQENLHDHPRIKIVQHRRNRGVSRTRNTGIRNSHGNYITFLDSDDEYLAHHLDSRQAILRRDPNIQLLHGGLEVKGDPYVVNKDDFRQRIHVRDCAVGGTFFIRSDVFEKIGLFRKMRYAEDAEFFERVLKAKMIVRATRCNSYRYYRGNADQLTSQLLAATNSPGQKIARWLFNLKIPKLNMPILKTASRGS